MKDKDIQHLKSAGNILIEETFINSPFQQGDGGFPRELWDVDFLGRGLSLSLSIRQRNETEEGRVRSRQRRQQSKGMRE